MDVIGKWYPCRDLVIRKSWPVWTENIRCEEAIRILKRDTRHFAKRQLTWFRREQDVIWLDKEAFHWDESEILEHMMNILSERGIL